MRRAERALLLACWCAVANAAWAQAQTDNPDWAQAGTPPPPKMTAQDVEWEESNVPPPPAFDEKRLLSIEMPPYMSLKFGVDPGTITITGDGIVRYVVVASNRSAGATNAFYEGVRCATAEAKSYARFNNGAWETVKNPEWKKIVTLNSRYAGALSTQVLCRGNAPRASVADMIQNGRDPYRKLQ